MSTPNVVAGRPEVSIIVPARNEEPCLRACLESLLAQGGVSSEIIVVNDASTDRTGEIAHSFSGVKVIDPGPLPMGWTGKNHALTTGAQQARGEWLLFTDADTIHRPGSLARSLAEAKQQGAALLSYSPEQEVHGFWEKAIMPVIFAELAARYEPSRVRDPASPVAAANGQYLLISRDAYLAVGGHAAVPDSLLEDVALARVVKTSGRKIFFRYGPDAVRTRMYRSFWQLREGWTKNLALLFPSVLQLALLRMLEFVVIVASAALAIVEFVHGRAQVAAVIALLAVVLFSFFIQRIRKAHFPWDVNLLALFGLPLFSYLLLRSRLSHKRGTVGWKGRTYGSNPAVKVMPQIAAQERHLKPLLGNKRIGRL